MNIHITNRKHLIFTCCCLLSLLSRVRRMEIFYIPESESKIQSMSVKYLFVVVDFFKKDIAENSTNILTK